MSVPRFLTPPEVADELNVSLSQVRAILRSGKLRGVQIGGRGIWRIERAELERYIDQLYDESPSELDSVEQSEADSRSP